MRRARIAAVLALAVSATAGPLMAADSPALPDLMPLPEHIEVHPRALNAQR